MNRTALEQVLAAEGLEGWDPSDEQIAELEAVLVGTLSRREYFEQELARAVGLSSPIPPRIRWRRSAPYVYRGTSVPRTTSTCGIPLPCNHRVRGDRAPPG
ncbi:hypothetical protein GCM10020255_079380 [Rhodococcus baikonurensis]